MRYKTVIEEMFEEEIEKKRMKISRSLIGLGLLTDEQIAGVTEQTPEDIAELRHKLQKAEH